MEPRFSVPAVAIRLQCRQFRVVLRAFGSFTELQQTGPEIYQISTPGDKLTGADIADFFFTVRRFVYTRCGKSVRENIHFQTFPELTHVLQPSKCGFLSNLRGRWPWYKISRPIIETDRQIRRKGCGGIILVEAGGSCSLREKLIPYPTFVHSNYMIQPIGSLHYPSCLFFYSYVYQFQKSAHWKDKNNTLPDSFSLKSAGKFTTE